MKRIVIILISIILLVIDNTLLPYYSIKGAFPSLLFVFAIGFSIVNGKKEAVFIGVLSGILQDVFFVKGNGINALINLLLCVLAATIGENILKENRIIPVISTFILSVMKIFMAMILLYLFKQKVNLPVALLSSVFNSIVMLIVYKFILTTSNKFMDSEEWRFKW